MCGFTGILNLKGDSISQNILKKMTDELHHRGPDGEGYWIDRQMGMGHRRLTVIDLSEAGQQPMYTPDSRFVLAYNGEIYNYLEFRSKLEGYGIRFKSKTDTEVILYSLAKWGPSILNEFNGMFSLALWDRQKKELLLARDRYGIKPLYYAEQNNNILFASEQKAIVKFPDFSKKLNKDALLEYFTFQNIFKEHTLIKDIKLISPGSYLIINTDIHNIPKYTFKKYWDFCFSEDNRNSIEENQECLEYLLKQAVNRQLIGDVEIGAYLSGGIDSGAITALAATKFKYLKSFTIGFDLSSASGIELAYDERTKAEAMSAHFKTEHYEMILKAGDMERCFDKLVNHLEEPRVGQSYPNYYAALLASKFVKVILSGVGGDELFGGYPWRYNRNNIFNNIDNYIHNYYMFWNRLIPNHEVKEVFSPIWNEIKDINTIEIFKNIFLQNDNELKTEEDYINNSMYFEAKTFLHGLLIVEDKLSMAHGLENRVPFMDNDLVDFAMQCPVKYKLNNTNNIKNIDRKKQYQTNGNNNGKIILRNILKTYIPENILQASKQGFSAPDASWFKGESINFVKTKLLNKNTILYNYFDCKQIKNKINDHLTGKQNHRLLIWSLLNLEHILEEF